MVVITRRWFALEANPPLIASVQFPLGAWQNERGPQLVDVGNKTDGRAGAEDEPQGGNPWDPCPPEVARERPLEQWKIAVV